MKRLFIIVGIALAGCTYTGTNGGPVPKGCCKPGDKLNETGHTLQSCSDAGGIFIGGPTGLCTDLDF